MKYFFLVILTILTYFVGNSQTSELPEFNNKRIQAKNSTDSLMLIGQYVNLRKGPSIDSPIVSNLRYKTPLKYLNKKVLIQNKRQRQYWIKVQSPTDSGYVHSSLLMFPKFQAQSLQDSTILFLQSVSKLIVLKNDSIVYVHTKRIGVIDTMYSRNTIGIPELEVILVRNFEPYCGGYSGTTNYCWNGNKIMHCGGDGDWGELNMGYINRTIFRPQSNNKTSYIQHSYSSYEEVNLPPIDECPRSVRFTLESTNRFEQYNGDSLVPIDINNNLSSPFKTLLKEKFNTSVLPQTSLQFDINKDGFKDAFFIHHGIYFALSDTVGQLHIQAQNIALDNQAKRCNITSTKDGLAINLIKPLSDDHYIFRRIEFEFNKDLNQLIVKRTLDLKIDEDYNYLRNEANDIQYFKTNNIVLDHIW